MQAREATVGHGQCPNLPGTVDTLSETFEAKKSVDQSPISNAPSPNPPPANLSEFKVQDENVTQLPSEVPMFILFLWFIHNLLTKNKQAA